MHKNGAIIVGVVGLIVGVVVVHLYCFTSTATAAIASFSRDLTYLRINLPYARLGFFAAASAFRNSDFGLHLCVE
jgi:hypothetical protein